MTNKNSKTNYYKYNIYTNIIDLIKGINVILGEKESYKIINNYSNQQTLIFIVRQAINNENKKLVNETMQIYKKNKKSKAK